MCIIISAGTSRCTAEALVSIGRSSLIATSRCRCRPRYTCSARPASWQHPAPDLDPVQAHRTRICQCRMIGRRSWTCTPVPCDGTGLHGYLFWCNQACRLATRHSNAEEPAKRTVPYWCGTAPAAVAGRWNPHRPVNRNVHALLTSASAAARQPCSQFGRWRQPSQPP